MSDDAAAGGAPPPAERPRGVVRRWTGRIAFTLLVLIGLAIAAAGLFDTSFGHRHVADKIAALRPANGLRYSVGRIEGSLYGKATLIDVRVSDPKGLVFRAPRAALDWRPFAWSVNKLDIRTLAIPRATLHRLPQTISTGKRGPLLPGFDIAIGELRVDRLDVAPVVTGIARRGSLRGSADIRDGRAVANLAAVVEGSDRLMLRLDAVPDAKRFDVDLSANGSATGVLAKLSGIAKPLVVEVHGDGDWQRWRGTGRVDVGPATAADLRLANDAGRYSLGGTLVPGLVTGGKLARLTAPRVIVSGAATLADRRLDGTISARSVAVAIESTGVLDLADSAYRNVRVIARLLRPAALFPDMTGRDIELRAILDGAFATVGFDYRLTAARFAFGTTGFDRVRAGGRGRWSKSPVTLPIDFRAARVTGVGDVAGGILGNLRVTGPLRISASEITGDALRLTSDRLNARITLFLDLKTGRYDVGLTGGLQRYLIPGIGIVDVTSRLQVVPGPGGRGTRVVGSGTAQVQRLDNGFFRSLTGGNPKIVTGLERGADGVLYFRNLVLTSPGLTLRGNGLRRRDGTFHFEGAGRQARYGPLTLKLDGRIDRPTIDLVLQRPADALGLSNVRAHLDPTAQGFAFTAAGGSRLGPFAAAGAILLPKGGTTRIAVARLDVAGARATGAIDIVPAGFAGRLELTGAATGTLTFRPQDGVQRIDALLDARGATLAGTTTVRRAHVEAAVLLDPRGTDIDATVQAIGIRQGRLSIGRLAANARLRDGVGTLRLSLAGNRSRAFAIQSEIAVQRDRYVIQASGTFDRRPLALQAPAVLVRDRDGWTLQPARLTFAGGEAQVGARLTGGETSVDASLTRMPLSVLDIGFPGLGLGGSATGKLAFTSRDGAAPTGRIDMVVRGLTRAGVALASKPIDVGVAGILSPTKLAARAVMASGGSVIGRGQIQVAPLAGGDLANRILNGALFAQLRYAGPGDTLWRMTGVELFDIAGPVAIGADLTGRLSDPRIRGSVRSEQARIESATTGTSLRNVQMTGRFDGSRLVLDRFAAQDAGAGRVTGTGAFDFGGGKGIGIDLSLDIRNTQVIARDDIAAVISGPVRIRSQGSGGVISGDVTVLSARYRLGRAAQAAAIPRLNIREINAPTLDEADDAPSEPWRLDVKANVADSMTVRGLGLDSMWGGTLAVRGEPANPQISGRLELVRGTYEFAGREFSMSRGVIGFDGSMPANPSLDIAANATTSNLNATIRVTGSSERPEISFTSVPALPQDELLSRLLFGTSITSLSAPEALQLAAAVSALQNGGNGLNPINAVRRATGLDRLRILPADVQTGAKTSVAAGKFLTRRLYAEIISDGQGYSATRLEFQITRWLSLLSSVSTVGRQSVNVRVSKDY